MQKCIIAFRVPRLSSQREKIPEIYPLEIKIILKERPSNLKILFILFLLLLFLPCCVHFSLNQTLQDVLLSTLWHQLLLYYVTWSVINFYTYITKIYQKIFAATHNA